MSHYTLTKYISRLMAVLLAVTLLLTVVPAGVAAEAGGSCGDNLTWSLSEGTLTITGSGDMEDYPYDTKAPWYELRNEIVRLELPDGLTSIGDMAFYGCNKLKTVVIPNSVTRIGQFAFNDCSDMELLNLGTGIRTIEESAFSDCLKVASITLPATVQYIGMKAFYRCETITSITVPSSVTQMEKMVFGYCKSLVTADIQANISEIPEWLFYECRSLVSVKLPDKTEAINEYSFDGCDQLNTVYYNGENKTPEEIQKDVDKSVPGFGKGGYVTNDTPTNMVSSGTIKDNEDGTTTQENTTVIQGNNAGASSEITVIRPTGENMGGNYSAEVTVVVDDKTGWEEAGNSVDTLLDQYEGTVSGNNGTPEQPHVTVYVKDPNPVDQAFVDKVTNRDVTVTIITQDGSIWQIKGTDVDTKTKADSYDLRYEVTPGSAELCEELGTTKCYAVRFLESAQINAEVMILLNPSLSLQNATLFERRENLATIQSSVIDMDGYVHFYLASVAEDSEYYIALNVEKAADTAIIPEVIQTAYGKPEYVEPIKYEITGRKSSWGMTFNQVTWIMAGVLGGCVVLVGIVMYILNKRKLRMGYVPEWDDEGYE